MTTSPLRLHLLSPGQFIVRIVSTERAHAALNADDLSRLYPPDAEVRLHGAPGGNARMAVHEGTLYLSMVELHAPMLPVDHDAAAALGYCFEGEAAPWPEDTP